MRRCVLLSLLALVACAPRSAKQSTRSDKALASADSLTTATSKPEASEKLPSSPREPPQLNSTLQTSPSATPAATLPTAASSVESNGSGWCLEGFSSFEDDTCYLIPPKLAQPKALLIYLHGVIAPGGTTQRIVQGIVARNALARGYVAMMPKGKRGLGPPPVQDWWSWPTKGEHHRKYAKTMVDSWIERKRQLETRLGPFERTYLAGSSNGAFFATVLALRGEFVADGFGAMSGGSRAGRTKASLLATAKPPFYVGYGLHDDLKPHPISLGELLQEAGWPHQVSAHNTGHGAREVYLEEAFAFWQK